MARSWQVQLLFLCNNLIRKKGDVMTYLFIKLLEIMDKECKNDKQWQKNKPKILGDEKDE